MELYRIYFHSTEGATALLRDTAAALLPEYAAALAEFELSGHIFSSLLSTKDSGSFWKPAQPFGTTRQN